MKRISLFLAIAGLIFTGSLVQAAEINFKNLEVGVTGLVQDDGNSVSGLIRYAPTYDLNEMFRLGVSVDFAPHKFNDETKFNAMNLLLNAEYLYSPEWSFGISAGTETWSCSSCKAKSAFGATVRKAYAHDFNYLKVTLASGKSTQLIVTKLGNSEATMKAFDLMNLSSE